MVWFVVNVSADVDNGSNGGGVVVVVKMLMSSYTETMSENARKGEWAQKKQ